MKGYRSARKHVFSLASMDLAANRVISRMISSFKKSCSHREVQPPGWNLSLALQSLTHPPHAPMKLSLDKHVARKTCFLFALVLAQRLIELHGLSCRVTHLGMGVVYFLFHSRLCCKDSESFIAATKKKKQVSRNTNLFWIRSVIQRTYGSATDCRLIKINGHEVED